MTRTTTTRRRKKNNDSNLPSSSSFKCGNYSLLHVLSIVYAAGPEGIPTRKLLDEIGSHATYTRNMIIKAYKLGLIDRKLGEEPGPGQFVPVINTIAN